MVTVGRLIAAVTVEILEASVVDVPSALLAVAAFAVLYRYQAKLKRCCS